MFEIRAFHCVFYCLWRASWDVRDSDALAGGLVFLTASTHMKSTALAVLNCSWNVPARKTILFWAQVTHKLVPNDCFHFLSPPHYRPTANWPKNTTPTRTLMLEIRYEATSVAYGPNRSCLLDHSSKLKRQDGICNFQMTHGKWSYWFLLLSFICGMHFR